MKRTIIATFGVGCLFSALQAHAQPGGPPAAATAPTNAPATDFSKIFKNDLEELSYAIGMNYGDNIRNTLKARSVDVDPEVVARGFKEAVSGGKTLITLEQDREILNAYQTNYVAKMEEKRKAVMAKNKKESEEFLAANKSKPGVVTLPSGLQYKVIAEGSGKSPTSSDMVTVNYVGSLIDGTEFDSTKPGVPWTTRVSGVIPGWKEALQLMKPGAKWQLYVPSELAYGERGSGPKIGGNAALVFNVELLSVTAVPPPITNNEPMTSDIIKVPSAEELKKGAKIETIKPEDIEKEKAKENK